MLSAIMEAIGGDRSEQGVEQAPVSEVEQSGMPEMAREAVGEGRVSPIVAELEAELHAARTGYAYTECGGISPSGGGQCKQQSKGLGA